MLRDCDLSFSSIFLANVNFPASRILNSNQTTVTQPISIEHRPRTVDHRLRTGNKTRTRYEMQTRNYGLSIKHGLGIKRGLRTVYVKQL